MSTRTRVFVGIVLLIVITVVFVAVKYSTTPGDAKPSVQASTTVVKPDQSTTSALPTDKTLPAVEPTGTVLDYFPHEIGMSWTYEITTENIHPLQYWATYWEEVTLGFNTRVSVKPPGERPPLTHELTLRVVGEATVAVDETVYSGVELSILKDELGLYYGVDKFFWVFLPEPNNLVAMAVYVDDIFLGYDKNIALVKGTTGCAMRPLLFDGESGEEQSLVFDWDKAPRDDLLYFDGSDGKTLEFTRQVAAAQEVGVDYDRAFTEKSIFELGKGLVFLQQKVGNITSMTWELVSCNFAVD